MGIFNLCEEEYNMFYLCYQIHGKQACFPVNTIVDTTLVRRPGHGPINLPPFELAVTMIELVNQFEGSQHSDLGNKLIEVSKAFIEQTKAGLPKGVEIVEYHPSEKQTIAA